MRPYLDINVRSFYQMDLFCNLKAKKYIQLLSFNCPCLGGTDLTGQPLNTLFMSEDPLTDWYQLPPFKAPKAGMSTHVVDGKIFIFGGSNIKQAGDNSVEIFDTQSQKWSQVSIAVLNVLYRIRGTIGPLRFLLYSGTFLCHIVLEFLDICFELADVCK